MTIETRPALDGIPDEQRTLALAHWWLFRVYASVWGYIVDTDVVAVLLRLEAQMQPETTHRLAQARDRYWREVRA